MITNKDYEYIEITRNFPLCADDFKIGNARDEDVRKVKQHRKIEQAILSFFPHLDKIKQVLDKKDLDLVEKYKSFGFSIGEISLLCREVSLQVSMNAFIVKNGGALDEVSANILGLYYKQKEIFDTPEEVKSIIRLDAQGIFPPNINDSKTAMSYDGKSRTLCSEYFNEFNGSHKYEIVGGTVSEGKNKGKRNKDNINGKTPKIIGGKKKLKSGLPEYELNDYDLNTSETWKNVFSKFENFRELEQNLKLKMQELKFNPKTIEKMGIYEFKDLIIKTFANNEKESSTIFTGAANKRVIDILKNNDNCDTLRKFLLFSGHSEKVVDLRMKIAKEQGILSGNLSTHHIVHVSNAGETLNYNLINDPDNLIVVSELLHKIIHSQDKMNGKMLGLYPKRGNFDFMLSITPIFRTKYTGEKTKDNELDKEAVRDKNSTGAENVGKQGRSVR